MDACTRILNISEGLSLAMHALNLLAMSDENITSKEIARITGFSSNHLSKVLHKLVEGEIIDVSKGIGGGFSLSKKQRGIKLLKIYETIEGKIRLNTCLYKNPLCDCKNCIFGNIIKSLNTTFLKYLQTTKIEDLNTKIIKVHK